jgi:hypothetical protein
MIEHNFWPEHNEIRVVKHYCMDDGCFVDSTTEQPGIAQTLERFRENCIMIEVS